MNYKDLEIVYKDITELKPFKRNPKEHPQKQIDNIAISLEKYGWRMPLLINFDNGEIIAGHGRILAARKLNMTRIPCIDGSDMSHEQIAEYRYLDNKLNESEWNIDILRDDLPNLDFSDFDLDFGLGEGYATEEETNYDSSNGYENQDDEWDDIEKQENRYGVPYQGNKSRIADIIISILPGGKRLVDLFGGGGAITHCAMLTGKWESYLYNDINPLITGLFSDAINGKYKDENRVITREDFERLKDTDAYVKYIWSFGNNGEGYLWGKDIEDIKCNACRALIGAELHDRRIEYRHFINLLVDKQINITKSLARIKPLKRLEPLERLESLQNLQSLEGLESLQRLEISNISYKDYEYKDGDIVYCDIPYEHINEGECNDYGLTFDSKEFYKWAKTRPYQIFFTSYEISDKAFYNIKLKSIASLMVADTNAKKVNEYLYSNKEIKIEK